MQISGCRMQNEGCLMWIMGCQDKGHGTHDTSSRMWVGDGQALADASSLPGAVTG